MANRAEQRKRPRFVDISESGRPVDEPVGESGSPPAPSVPAALEKLASATQRVISKRIDLVALEGQELASSLILKAALIAFAAIAGLFAWLSAVAGLVYYLLPASGKVAHLFAFAGINAAVAAVVAVIAMTRESSTTVPTAREEDAAAGAGDQPR